MYGQLPNTVQNALFCNLNAFKGSIPGPGVICGLSLFVVYSAPRGFSPGTPVFPSPQKPTLDLIVSITKFSIVTGSPRAYLSRNRRAITWVSNYRCPI